MKGQMKKFTVYLNSPYFGKPIEVIGTRAEMQNGDLRIFNDLDLVHFFVCGNFWGYKAEAK